MVNHFLYSNSVINKGLDNTEIMARKYVENFGTISFSVERSQKLF